jgi:hypothetical protein
MVGAIILVMAAWLSSDAYTLQQKDTAALFRTIGFVLFAIWKVIDALNLGNDILSYAGFALFIIGLLFLLCSLVRTQQLAFNAVLIIPAFSLWGKYGYAVSGILLLIISYLSLRRWKKEFDRTLLSFSIAFFCLAVASFLNITGYTQTDTFAIISRLVELLGFGFLAFWIWQYMRLRMRESFVMISVGVTFIMATIVTLAFSTILINRVDTETATNLLTDTKMLDFSITSLEQESFAQAQLIAQNQDISDALSQNNMALLSQSAERLLEQYNLGFLTITDNQGSVLIRADALSKRGDSLVDDRAYQEAMLQTPVVTIENSTVEGFSIRSGAPVISKGKIIGTIITGFPLDSVFADRMKKLTGLEMFVYSGNTSVAGTVFAADGETRLVGESMNDPLVQKTVLSEGNDLTVDTQIYGETFRAGFLPLVNSDEKIVGMISVARAQQDIVDIANTTNRLTLITVLSIMFILLLPIYFISRRFRQVHE